MWKRLPVWIRVVLVILVFVSLVLGSAGEIPKWMSASAESSSVVYPGYPFSLDPSGVYEVRSGDILTFTYVGFGDDPGPVYGSVYSGASYSIYNILLYPGDQFQFQVPRGGYPRRVEDVEFRFCSEGKTYIYPLRAHYSGAEDVYPQCLENLSFSSSVMYPTICSEWVVLDREEELAHEVVALIVRDEDWKGRVICFEDGLGLIPEDLHSGTWIFQEALLTEGQKTCVGSWSFLGPFPEMDVGQVLFLPSVTR